MRLAAVVFALVVASVSSAQPTSVLRIRVTLMDAAQTLTPVSRYALLVSDDPPTREPRRVITGPDGTVTLTLRAGDYFVESDRPATIAGRTYQWTQLITLEAGRETTLDLSVDNAELVEPGTATDTGVTPAGSSIERWHRSLVTVWTPTARATGFVVDERGLIATDAAAVGSATTVEVQLTPQIKVAGRVLSSPTSEVAIVWIDPSLLAGIAPMSLPCASTTPPPLDDGDVLTALASAYDGDTRRERGEVTQLGARQVQTNFRLPFGGAGGPVFNDAGIVAGVTTMRVDVRARRAVDIGLVRAVFMCEAVTSAQAKLAGATPPPTARLPVEPAMTARAPALPAQADAAPARLSSANFDIALLTPRDLASGRARADRTGGRQDRPPEIEARLGRLTDLGAWSEYFEEAPPLLIVRVTPKLVEGFWRRLGREAARTQGAALPAFKSFTNNFARLQATCGGTDVVPVHPFVLEHEVAEKTVVREGLYVFAPETLGPQCATVTLSVYSEGAPKPDTVSLDRAIVTRLWQDFAAPGQPVRW